MGNRDQILPFILTLYIEDAKEVSALVFTLISALCFDKNLVKGRAADCSASKFRCSRGHLRVTAVLRKVVSINGVGAS